jgi:uncharacterized protein YndB with AHSA1/START domain
MPNRNPTLEATLIRRFAAPLALVYQVWRESRHLERWLSPADDIRMEVLEFEFREGGAYRYQYTWGEGNVMPVSGRFLTIEPERCLIFSWEPQPSDPDAGKETMVSVWFRACGDGGTEVEVRHTLFPDEAMRARHQEGWTSTLDRLGRWLASPEGTRNENQTTKQTTQ